MHRPLEVAHRLLKLLGLVGEAGEGEVGRQPGLAPLVVRQGAQEALERLLAGLHILREQARTPYLEPQVSWLGRIVEQRFEAGTRIVELLFVHRKECIEQSIPVGVVFVGLRLVPLAHQKGDPLFVGHLGRCRLVLSFFRFEPIEQGLGLLVNGLVNGNLQRALELLFGQLDRSLRRVCFRFVDASARDAVGASMDLVDERCARVLGRCSERLLVHELGWAVVACSIECVGLLLERLGVGGKQFLQ